MSQVETTDFLVIGAGVAGLRAAIALAAEAQVLVVTKESLGESNTHYAQGGIAVASEDKQEIALHLEDTIAAGDGLVYRPAAQVLVAEGPQRVAELIEWGAAFDREGNLPTGQLLRTREAAHSQPRILHAQGDATGAEISRSLVAFARNHPRIHFAEWTMATNLVVEDGRVIAADLMSSKENVGAPGLDFETGDRRITRVRARSVLIASGGAGQVYSDTTNPAVATGDGIYLAAQAGAELADMEFYQFHPTALSLPGVPRFLLSEALRGEGAWLRNDRGERFMERYHASLELAPRDVVARAIAREGMGATPAESRLVYLDMRHVRDIDLTERFPGISRFLAQHGLSLQHDLIPVRPAAHYLMGGIRTDLDGRTTVPGLYAAGEAACTGVHGANRLASNSLLEGLVFGARAASAMLADGSAQGRPEGFALETQLGAPSIPRPMRNRWEEATSELRGTTSAAHVEEIIEKLQRSMWANAGLLRQASTLEQGQAYLDGLESELAQLSDQGKGSRRFFEARALCAVARAILRAAQARTESRGAHFRNDYPKRDDRHFQKHSTDQQGQIRFEPWPP